MKQVKVTKDYSLFEFVRGNRPLGKRVNRMVKSMKRKNLLKDFPILASPPNKKTGRRGILDGQTRFEAAKRLGLPIYFTDAEQVVDIEDVSHANAAQRPWTPTDYVQSFSEQGNPNYVKLRDFMNEFGLPASTSVSLLLGVDATGGRAMEYVREGSFKIKPEAENEARKVGAAIASLKTFVPFANDRSLAMAIKWVMKVKSFDVNRFIKKVRLNPAMLQKRAHYEQYVELIEEIYNYRVRAQDITSLALEVKKMVAANRETQNRAYREGS